MACNLASRREAQQGRRILDWSPPSVSAYLVGRGLGIGIGNAVSSRPSEAGDASRMPILADRHSGPFRCPQIFGGQGSRGAPVVGGMQLKQARTPPGLAPEDTDPHSAAEAVGAVDRPRTGDRAHPTGRRTTRQNAAIAIQPAAQNGTY